MSGLGGQAPSEFAAYLGELRSELDKLPSRPAKGELLRRAMEIPLAWPESEFPAARAMADQFTSAIGGWGGKVHRVKGEAEVVAKAAEIVQESGARRLRRWRSPRLDRFEWEQGLSHLTPEWLEVSSDERAAAREESARRAIIQRLEPLEIGITDCDLAVAHTGSVVCLHDGERDGFTNLFPWTNICVVWLSQMVRTVQDAVEKLESTRPSGAWAQNVQFITGPSRSGDIDLTAGQGAAGPGRYHVILVEDAS